MFMKKDMARYKSGCADKNPEELPGVRENRFFCPLRVEKYGLSIWMGYISILGLLLKSCARILRHSAARPHLDISHLSLTKQRLRKN